MEKYYHNDTNIPLEDQMLVSLYKGFKVYGKDAFFDLSASIPNKVNWRIIAGRLYEKDFIEYPGGFSYSETGRIKQKGIDYIEKKYG